ncbi:hypothetical protein CA13_33620 [Planctomycetes bacterium CA13]|uniref:DUF1570 domain-containing protein n=1 Tax=Novipirellula herctigrandis TaxID=2527986 RepID=A0A5C5Z4H1_9BACT|nr:hypothetical protein CA13_33620 [Planctomycetes bacterium CA13]
MNAARTLHFLIGLWTGLAICHFAVAGDFAKYSGKHITLTTDIESDEEASRLVESFDAVVPQWEEFFDLPNSGQTNWQIEAFVMRDKSAFIEAGLISGRIPEFSQGYALGNTVWVVAQPSEYYTRHLLLHEGVHALAIDRFDGTGPSWFAEGTAEVLSTHRFVGSDARVGGVPVDRESVPYWGRLKVMSERRTEGDIPAIETVMRYPADLKADPEAYGWSWAAVMLLSEYPEYRSVYQAAAREGRDNSSQFTRQLYQRLFPQWPAVVARWRLMCNQLDYGYNWDANRVAIDVSDPLWNGAKRSFPVDASQGWQSSGVRIPASTTFQVSASGRCTIANHSNAQRSNTTRSTNEWISEPPGVTIRYVNGKPLGQLLACLVPTKRSGGATYAPLKIVPINSETQLKCTTESWLVFQINDATSDRSDNSGSYQVQLAR